MKVFFLIVGFLSLLVGIYFIPIDKEESVIVDLKLSCKTNSKCQVISNGMGSYYETEYNLYGISIQSLTGCLIEDDTPYILLTSSNKSFKVTDSISIQVPTIGETKLEIKVNENFSSFVTLRITENDTIIDSLEY